MCKSSRKTGKAWERSYEIYRKGVCYNYVGGTYIVHVELEIGVPAASFQGSRVWAEKKKPGTDCLHILSSPTISGFLEIWKFPYNMLCYTNFHDASRLLFHVKNSCQWPCFCGWWRSDKGNKLFVYKNYPCVCPFQLMLGMWLKFTDHLEQSSADIAVKVILFLTSKPREGVSQVV